MIPELTDDDYPEIGMCLDGYMLVCHGDDRPVEWAAWLQPIVERFEEARSLAEENGMRDLVFECLGPWTSIVEFCEAVGIEMGERDWLNTGISGTYHLGWVQENRLDSVEKEARRLVDGFVSAVRRRLRSPQ